MLVLWHRHDAREYSPIVVEFQKIFVTTGLSEAFAGCDEGLDVPPELFVGQSSTFG